MQRTHEELIGQLLEVTGSFMERQNVVWGVGYGSLLPQCICEAPIMCRISCIGLYDLQSRQHKCAVLLKLLFIGDGEMMY